MRAECIIRRNGSAAIGACLFFGRYRWCSPDSRVVEEAAAVFAYPEGRAFFHGKERDEKEAQIVVCSFSAYFVMPADRTGYGPPAENSGFGLDAAYEKKHHP